MDSSNIHPFERAGLGKAPFRYVGMVAQDMCHGERILNREEFQATGVALTTKPGGTCAYCGTYIVNMYNIRSADGRVFHVGSDCVEKTADRKLVEAVKLEKRRTARENRKTKAAAVDAELRTLMTDEKVRAKLATVLQPNAKPWQSVPEHSLLNWTGFMFQISGATGRAKVLKAVKAALDGK